MYSCTVFFRSCGQETVWHIEMNGLLLFITKYIFLLQTLHPCWCSELRNWHNRWGSNSTNSIRPLPKIVVVDVAGNTRLGGTIPDGWGIQGRSFLVTRGERILCMPFSCQSSQSGS